MVTSPSIGKFRPLASIAAWKGSHMGSGRERQHRTMFLSWVSRWSQNPDLGGYNPSIREVNKHNTGDIFPIQIRVSSWNFSLVIKKGNKYILLVLMFRILLSGMPCEKFMCFLAQEVRICTSLRHLQDARKKSVGSLLQPWWEKSACSSPEGHDPYYHLSTKVGVGLESSSVL